MKAKFYLFISLFFGLNASANIIEYSQGEWNGNLKIGQKNYLCKGKKELIYDHAAWQRGETWEYHFICLNPSDKNQALWIIPRVRMNFDEKKFKPYKGEFNQDCKLTTEGWNCSKKTKISGKVAIKTKDLKTGELYAHNCMYYVNPNLSEKDFNDACEEHIKKNEELQNRTWVKD